MIAAPNVIQLRAVASPTPRTGPHGRPQWTVPLGVQGTGTRWEVLVQETASGKMVASLLSGPRLSPESVARLGRAAVDVVLAMQAAESTP